MKEKKEKRYIVNDLLLQVDEFSAFLQYLGEKYLEFTFTQSFSSDLIEYKIICRPSVFEVYQIHLTNEALFGAGFKDKNTKLDAL